MKIAIPLTEHNLFAAHYGASAKFAIYEIDEAHRSVRQQEVFTPTADEPCSWAPLLSAEGVNVLLVGGMGRGAQQNMQDNGIQLIVGVPPLESDALMAAYLAYSLSSGKNLCEEQEGHHHHHHDHHEGHHCTCSH